MLNSIKESKLALLVQYDESRSDYVDLKMLTKVIGFLECVEEIQLFLQQYNSMLNGYIIIILY